MDYDSWTPRFRVACSVSGGVTGYRQSYLKKNGKERIFKTYRAAEKAVKEFDRYHNDPDRQKYSLASFKAWIEEF